MNGNKMGLNDSERSRLQSRNGNKFPPARKQATAKGHDAQLKDAQDNGKPIVLKMLSDGSTEKGIITNRDKFSVTLLKGNEKTIYYKHAIESISIVEPQYAPVGVVG